MSCRDIMNKLDSPGWRTLLFTEEGEAPEGTEPDDPSVIRREQWFVAGDQYLVDFGWGPELGEHGPAGEWSGKRICGIFSLVEIVRIRLQMGQSRDSIHPILLELL